MTCLYCRLRLQLLNNAVQSWSCTGQVAPGLFNRDNVVWTTSSLLVTEQRLLELITRYIISRSSCSRTAAITGPCAVFNVLYRSFHVDVSIEHSDGTSAGYVVGSGS